MTIGENIRKFRTSLKLTQKELGDLIGTTQQMIAQYENGRRNPKVETLNKIAQALHTTVEELSNHTMYYFESSFENIFGSDNTPSPLDDLIRTHNMGGSDRFVFIEAVNTWYEQIQLRNETFPEAIESLIKNFYFLNLAGRIEAIKRVSELTEIKKYTDPDDALAPDPDHKED